MTSINQALSIKQLNVGMAVTGKIGQEKSSGRTLIWVSHQGSPYLSVKGLIANWYEHDVQRPPAEVWATTQYKDILGLLLCEPRARPNIIALTMNFDPPLPCKPKP